MESSVIQVRKLTQLKTNPTEKERLAWSVFNSYSIPSSVWLLFSSSSPVWAPMLSARCLSNTQLWGACGDPKALGQQNTTFSTCLTLSQHCESWLAKGFKWHDPCLELGWLHWNVHIYLTHQAFWSLFQQLNHWATLKTVLAQPHTA